MSSSPVTDPPPPPAGRRGEVVRVDRNVGLRGEAVATAARGGVVAAAEELHAVGDDVHALALVALLVLPLAPLEAAVDRDGAALGEVPGAVVALRAPDGDVEVVGLVDPLTGLVLAARVAGDAELADRGAAREGAKLGVRGEVACQHHSVDVRGRHWRLLLSGAKYLSASLERGSENSPLVPARCAVLLRSRARGVTSDG